MTEIGWHWALSSAAGVVLTGEMRPVCSVVYEMRDCRFRRGFLRAMDVAFAEKNHCRKIWMIYRLGRAIR